MTEDKKGGCLLDVAAIVATICGLQSIKTIFGRPVALAVSLTAFVLCITFLWHEGGKKAA